MVDAITTQVVRNRIASLMQEMHYHFYRSGYSTIIRESRDFSCVILNCRGGLIVAPPMFFHAPVYRHLVGNILERYGNDIHPGDMFVCNHPYEGGLPHVSDMALRRADLSRRNAGRLRRLDRPQGRCRRHQSRLDLGQRHRDFSGRIAAAAGEDLPPAAPSTTTWNGSSSPTAASPNWCAAICTRRWRRHGWAPTASLRPASSSASQTVMEAFAALLHGAAEELRAAIRTLPDGEASAEGFMDNDGVELDRPVRFAVTVRVKNGKIAFDSSNSDRQARGPVNLRPSMVEACVFYSLIGALDPKLTLQ